MKENIYTKYRPSLTTHFCHLRDVVCMICTMHEYRDGKKTRINTETIYVKILYFFEIGQLWPSQSMRHRTEQVRLGRGQAL